MKPKQPRSSDPNRSAADAVRASTDRPDDQLPPSSEAVWAAWSAGVQRIDERTRVLLRAAFEAGHEAGMSEFARDKGRKGGLARLSSMTPDERSESARAAARARWVKHS